MTYIYKIFFQFTLFFIIFALISNSYAIDGNQNTQNNIKSNEPIQPNTDSKTAKTPTPESESESESPTPTPTPTPTSTPTPITEKPDTVINSNQQDNKKNADKESGARNNDYIKKSNNLSNKEKNKEEKEQALNDEKAIDALLDTNKNITPQSKKLSKLVPNKIQSVDLDELNFNKNFNSILEVQLKEGSDILIEGIKNELEEENQSKDKKPTLDPVFIVTGITESISYFYGLEICKLLNSKKQYLSLNCMVLPVSSTKNAGNYLRRGKYSNYYKKLGVSADFIITRSNYLELHQLKKGPLKNYPDLDLVMFLNGEYIFALAPLEKNMDVNLSSIESILTTKQKVNILFMSTDSQSFFEEVTQNISKKSMNYTFYDYNFKEKYIMSKDSEIICNLKNIDLIVYVGSEFNENMIEFTQTCGKVLYPVTFKDSTINSLQTTSNEYSTANISKYYSLQILLNYNNVLSYKKSLSKDFGNQKEANSLKQNSKLDGDMFNVFLSNVKKDQKNNITKKEAKTVQQDFVFGEVAIKTIGVRYVIAATRYTKNTTVIKLMQGFLDDFSIIKGGLPTLDMSNFNLVDIIQGTQMNNSFIYHYAVGNFPKYINESRVSTDIDKIISKIIYNNKIDSKIPKLFGPEMPNQTQIQLLNNMHSLHTKERNLQKQINGVKRIVKDASYYMDEKNAIQNRAEIEKQLNKRQELKEKNKKINEISKEKGIDTMDKK
jgi:hypothetical protein